MSLLTIDNIEKTFGARVIFKDASITLYPGQRVGFIGANGAGKSTLFKMIMGDIEPDYGSISLAKGTKVGYLQQDPVFASDNSVIDEAEEAFADLHRLHHQLREMEHQMGDLQGDDADRLMRRYQDTQHEFELAGGYAFTHRLEATLQGVGLDEKIWDQSVQTLSGGQRSRLALAKLLIGEPDLLLLDEPTNHLDLDAIEWLEDYLKTFKGAVMVISHDRYLLDRLATRVVWLNQCKFDSFNGNYSDFVVQKELIELSQQRAYEQQMEMIEKQQEFIRRFQAGQRSKESRGRKTRLERFMKSDQMVAAVSNEHHIKLSLDTDQRAGDNVLKVRELSKAFGTNVLWNKITFEVRRGQRIGIIGPNGSGKTTLLRCLIGQDDADDGELRWGANLNIGYYDQRLDDFDPDLTVLEQVMEDRVIHEKTVRDLLARFLFRGDDIYKSMGLLSGGERARVRLAQLLLEKPNILLLDEPTNHLDIPSCSALEETLNDFPGTILCVSHDRYFLDKVATRILSLKPPEIHDFEGNYTAWQKRQQMLKEKAQAAKTAARKPAPKKVEKTKNPKKENRYARPFGRLTDEELESQIAQTEKQKAQFQNTLAQPDTYMSPKKAKAVQDQYDQAQATLQQLEAEYFGRE